VLGDAWLWLATDADTKLVPCWHVGRRDGDAAMEFIDDLASRLATRVQLTTDSLFGPRHCAHLRANIPAIRSLRAALDGILLMAEPKPDGPAN
jgi:transposase-like protein